MYVLQNSYLKCLRKGKNSLSFLAEYFFGFDWLHNNSKLEYHLTKIKIGGFRRPNGETKLIFCSNSILLMPLIIPKENHEILLLGLLLNHIVKF